MSTSLIPSISGGVSVQNYLSKKERVVGVLATLGLGAAALFFLGPIVLPSIVATLGLLNTAVSATAAIAIKITAIAAVLFVLSQPRTWTLGWHIFNIFSRAVSNLVIKMDPTGRLEAFADEYLASRRAKIITALVTVSAVKKENERKQEEYRRKIKDATERAQALLRLSFDQRTQRWSNEDHQLEYRRLSVPLKMWQDTLAGLERQHTRLELQQKTLDKFRQGFDFHIEMTRTFVDELKTRFAASQGMAEAARAISGSVEGGDMKRFFDQNVAYVEQSIAQFDAEAEVFMTEMPQFNRAFDVENDIAESELTSKLLEWDTRTDQALEAAKSVLALPASTAIPVTLPHPVEGEAVPNQAARAAARQKLLG